MKWTFTRLLAHFICRLPWWEHGGGDVGMISHGHYYENRYLMDFPWWRHRMETFSALLALCAGNSSVTGEFPGAHIWMRRIYLDVVNILAAEGQEVSPGNRISVVTVITETRTLGHVRGTREVWCYSLICGTVEQVIVEPFNSWVKPPILAIAHIAKFGAQM